MKKIISLFQRNYESDRLVRDEVVPGAEWVLAGEGWPTQKKDGACCMIRGGKLFKRYELKKGRTPPLGFEGAQDPDKVTGDCPGWVPVGDGPEDQWFREGFKYVHSVWDQPSTEGGPDGTYELCGPKIQGNPEGFLHHVLLRHGMTELDFSGRTFDRIKEYLSGLNMEGIVWHHPDGRMVKIKKKDFGLKR